MRTTPRHLISNKTDTLKDRFAAPAYGCAIEEPHLLLVTVVCHLGHVDISISFRLQWKPIRVSMRTLRINDAGVTTVPTSSSALCLSYLLVFFIGWALTVSRLSTSTGAFSPILDVGKDLALWNGWWHMIDFGCFCCRSSSITSNEVKRIFTAWSPQEATLVEIDFVWCQATHQVQYILTYTHIRVIRVMWSTGKKQLKQKISTFGHYSNEKTKQMPGGLNSFYSPMRYQNISIGRSVTSW